MTHHRIDRLLREGQLEEIERDARDIVGLWQKALENWEAYRTSDLPRATAFQVVYTAGLQIATAVLHAEGYRARGGTSGGHHRSTFYALRGLGHEEIDRIAVTLEASRSLRHAAIYDPTDQVPADEMTEVVEAVDVFFGLARDYVSERFPEVEDDLPVR